MTKCLAIDEFGRNKTRSIGGADFVNRQDIGMVERRSGFRFLHEPLQAVFVRRELFRQYLDRYRPIELGVVGKVNFAHTAGTDQRADFVPTELCSRFNIHNREAVSTSVNIYS